MNIKKRNLIRLIEEINYLNKIYGIDICLLSNTIHLLESLDLTHFYCMTYIEKYDYFIFKFREGEENDGYNIILLISKTAFKIILHKGKNNNKIAEYKEKDIRSAIIKFNNTVSLIKKYGKKKQDEKYVALNKINSIEEYHKSSAMSSLCEKATDILRNCEICGLQILDNTHFACPYELVITKKINNKIFKIFLHENNEDIHISKDDFIHYEETIATTKDTKLAGYIFTQLITLEEKLLNH